MNARKMAVFVFIALFTLVAMPAMAAESSICGEPQEEPLTAGQTIPVGTVTVSNDETNLYVKYETTGDWYLTQVHLYVLDEAPTDRLPPGQAPYKNDTLPEGRTQSYTITVPLAGLEFPVTCGTTQLWLQAHASVVRLNPDGTVAQTETAYGGDITDPPSPGSWYGNIAYVVQCCDNPPPEECFEDETAWAAGSRYVTRGNWATYTSYANCTTGVTLYAGQTYNAGTVTCTPDNGSVKVTICLNDGWRFDPDESENIKIQDYTSAPTGSNPEPGLFANKGYATGSCFDITVPLNSYYGIHVDVEREVECPPEPE